jgi:hypothetical protein
MAQGTWKPCPGCHQKTGHRPVDSVCKNCIELIQLGCAVQEEGVRKEDKQKLYRLSGDWPSIYSPARESVPPEKNELLIAFLALARAAMHPAKTKTEPYDESVEALPPASRQVHYCSYDERATLWTGNFRLAEAITRLDTAVRKAILDSYHEGEISGSDLLMRLASGKISMAEITDAHIEAGRRKK